MSGLYPPLKAYCINLDERKDRWNEIEDEFHDSGILLQRLSAIKASPGWIGCAKSHLEVVKTAKQQGLPWVLLIEDDCILLEPFKSNWPALQQQLWETRAQWDLFLGGPTFLQGPITLLSNNPIIFSLEIGYATHFALINASAYDAILRWNETKGPIDAYYTNALRLAAPYPLIAGQRESYSDIQQKQTNYAKFVEDSSRAIEIKLYQQRTRDITLGLVLLSLAALATWIKG